MTLNIHIPSRWIWKDWKSVKMIDGQAVVQEFRGLRVFVVLWRFHFHFRREPLGSGIARHGFSIMAMCPWGSIEWTYRDEQVNSLDLATNVTVRWGHERGWLLRPGYHFHTNSWGQYFHRESLMDFYQDESGIWRSMKGSQCP